MVIGMIHINIVHKASTSHCGLIDSWVDLVDESLAFDAPSLALGGHCMMSEYVLCIISH